MKQRIRIGMVGGGPGAWVGRPHRVAMRIDDRYDLVAGAFVHALDDLAFRFLKFLQARGQFLDPVAHAR